MTWKHNKAYDTPEYRAARKRVLANAKGCALAYPSICTGKPTEADHALGIEADPEHKHLQAVCGPCHDVKTAAERRAALAGGRAAWRPECVDDFLMDVNRDGRLELVHPNDGIGGVMIHASRDISDPPYRRMTDWAALDRGERSTWAADQAQLLAVKRAGTAAGKGSGPRLGSV